MDYTAHFYSKPSYVGAGGAIFSGSRRQRGGSILGSIKSVVVPFVKSIGRNLFGVAKKQAVGLASDVVSDAINGRNIKDSLKARGKQRLLKGAQQGLNKLRGVKRVKRGRQRGSGKRRMRKLSRKRKSSHRRGRKRKASRKNSSKSKRRRLNF